MATTTWTPDPTIVDRALEAVTIQSQRLDHLLDGIQDWPTTAQAWRDRHPEAVDRMDILLDAVGTLALLDRPLSWMYHDCLAPLADAALSLVVDALPAALDDLARALLALETTQDPGDRAALGEQVADALASRDAVETLLVGRQDACLAPPPDDLLRRIADADLRLHALLREHPIPADVRPTYATAWIAPRHRARHWWHRGEVQPCGTR